MTVGSNDKISKSLQIKEILRCGEDPIYFINKYVKIQHPQLGSIPFSTYDFQNDCINSYVKHRFNIVLKSRQLGLSTISAAYSVWLALFMKDKNILVIATKYSTAKNFIKKVKTMINSLPKWLLLAQFDVTQDTVTLSNGSIIKAVPTSLDAGRSEALSLLIIDEAAFINNFEEIYTGLYPTLSEGGSAIILSTPNGVGGLYHRLWVEGVAKLNSFNTIRLPWDVHPEHDQAWFDKETRNLTPRKVAQEMLCEFLASGDTFLQHDTLTTIKHAIQPPIAKSGPRLEVWIWKHPRPNAKYLLASDVARGDAFDYSTFQIYDIETCEMVAEYLGKIPPDKLGELIFEFGTKYNNALAVVEQNTFGYFTNARLVQMSYPKLYYVAMENGNYNYVPTDLDEQPGFTQSAKTKQQILPKLEELLRNETMHVYSERLYNQLTTFVWHGNKASAGKGSNDDLVITAAIAAWICSTSEHQQADDISLIRACLNANSVEARNSAALIIQTTNGNNLRHGNVIDPKNPHKPQQHDTRRHGHIDFNWLLR